MSALRPKGHPPFKCWRRPDAKIIMEMKLPLATANGESRKQMLKLLRRPYFRGKAHFKQGHQIRSECWRIDGGCTNHMIYDETLFKDLQPTGVAQARIGGGRYILAKGKGIVTITTSSRMKTIF